VLARLLGRACVVCCAFGPAVWLVMMYGWKEEWICERTGSKEGKGGGIASLIS
jgi:hypothetical protein